MFPERPTLVKQIFDPPPSTDEMRRARARGSPNIECGIRGVVEKLGTSGTGLKGLATAVMAAREVDGLCPISADEMDSLRAEIVQKGRTNLPIG